MSLADKLKRLVRIVPGVSGYQDNESARQTDKAVRIKLSSDLDSLKLDIENVKRRLIEVNDLSLLPALDRTASKLFKSSNSIRYAARGFSGIFAEPRADINRLERLAAFDLALFDVIEDLRALTGNVGGPQSEASVLKKDVAELDAAVDSLDRKFSSRQAILTEL